MAADSAAGSVYSRVFAVAAVAILGVALFRILQPFLGSIAWALLAAFLLHPTHARLSRWLRGRPSLSASLLTVATLLICIGPLTALGLAFVRQAANLLERLPAGMGEAGISSLGAWQDIPVLKRALEWLHTVIGISPEQLQGWMVSGTESMLKYFTSAGGSLFMGAVGTVLGFAMMLFFLFFFLRDGAAMQAQAVRLIPMAEADKRKLADYLGAVTRAVVFGTLLTALIQGALVSVAFVIVGLPSPVVFGVIAAALSLLPIGGTAIVWIPAAIMLAAQGRWGAAIFMTLWGTLLVGLIDNILKPMLISGRAEVPTLAAFLGVLGGLAAFGAVGMFLGPILLALIIALLRFADEHGVGRGGGDRPF
jgi:predicted PurR-regulated permease PerM